jgi:hypothetical protein
MDNSPEQMQRASLDIQRGIPLRNGHGKIWHGCGNGKPCNGCGRSILRTEIEVEVDLDNGSTLRLHSACFVIWRSPASLAESSVSRSTGHDGDRV